MCQAGSKSSATGSDLASMTLVPKLMEIMFLHFFICQKLNFDYDPRSRLFLSGDFL